MTHTAVAWEVMEMMDTRNLAVREWTKNFIFMHHKARVGGSFSKRGSAESL